MIHSWEALSSQQITSTWLSNRVTNTVVAQPKAEHANTKYRHRARYWPQISPCLPHNLLPRDASYVLWTSYPLLGLPSGRFPLQLHGVEFFLREREKKTGPRLVKEFTAFYVTRRFIAIFTSTRHLSLSSAKSVPSMSPIPVREDSF